MSTVAQAEQLWARAHEQIRRNDLANAVRDLAACFQILQSLKDPRLYEVHKRWTEVHQMYLQRATATKASAPATTAQAITTQTASTQTASTQAASTQAAVTQATTAQATTAQATTAQATSAQATAATVVAATKPATAAAPTAPAAASAWFSAQRTVPTNAAPAAQAAPPMASQDAPVGMQSLDVPVTVGPEVDAAQAARVPVTAAPTQPPQAAFDPLPAGDAAALEEMLRRVHKHRRSPSLYGG